MRILPIALPALLALSLTACSKPAETPASAPAAEAGQAATPATPAAAANASGIGVPECDQYLEKVTACLTEHMPGAQGAEMKKALDGSREQWAQAAAQPGGKEALASACKQASDAAKQSYAAFGCSF